MTNEEKWRGEVIQLIEKDEILCKECKMAWEAFIIENGLWSCNAIFKAQHCHHNEETIKVTGHVQGKPNPILEQDVTIPLCPSAWEPMEPKC